MDWYYAEGTERKGPFDDATLSALRQRGVLRGDTLVYHTGLDGWKPYAQVAPPAVDSAVAAPPPAPAPEKEIDPVLAALMHSDESAADELVTCAHSGKQAPKSTMLRNGTGWVLPEYQSQVRPTYGQEVQQVPVREMPKEQILKARKMDGPELIGFWSRLGAHVIDNLILGIPFWLLLLPLQTAPESPAAFVAIGGIVVLPLLYFIFLVGKFGGTPGKRLLHYKVVDKKNAAPVTYARAAARFFSKLGFLVLGGLIYTLIVFVSESTLLAIILFLLPNITYLWIAWDEKKQGLHDHLAGTLVIRD